MAKKHKNNLGFSTRSIHDGVEPSPHYQAIMTPIYLSSTFVQDAPGEYLENYDYSRAANPTRSAFEENLASLESANHAYAFSSGVAAADVVLRMLEPGAEVICGDDVYGGSYRLFKKVFEPLGHKFHFVDLNDSAALDQVANEKTGLVWLESPSNPLLKVFDIEKVSAWAKKLSAHVMVDNTFASPYLQNPLSLGADIVMHSTTKYIGGHSDLIGGALICDDKDLAEKIYFLQKAVGAVPSPFDCFLMLRSTKTLAVRLERHCENAQAVAESLSSSSEVSKVIYPGLSSHPQFEIAKKQMRGPGGMISFVVEGGFERVKRLLPKLEIFSLAESLGGVESLIEHPASMTHVTIPKAEREKKGIVEGLLRLSIGLENKEDLIADLEQAIEKSKT